LNAEQRRYKCGNTTDAALNQMGCAVIRRLKLDAIRDLM